MSRVVKEGDIVTADQTLLKCSGLRCVDSVQEVWGGVYSITPCICT